MNNLELKMGMLGGVSLSMWIQVPWHSIQQTIVLAMIGAAVSFFISRYLQWLFDQKEVNGCGEKPYPFFYFPISL